MTRPVTPMMFAAMFSGALLPPALLAEPVPPVPDLESRIEAFQAERAAADSPFAPEDLAVMQDAARELAMELPEPGIPVGQSAPDFSLPNAYGETVRLQQLLRWGPVVLTFYRGAWCPYCNLQLQALRETEPHFKRYNAQLVAISPQMPDHSLKHIQEKGYPFEVLSDLDNRVMQAYHLYFEISEELNQVYQRKLGLDLAEYNGEGRYGLPVPGTFVIDQDGIVRAAFADTDYRKRMEPRAILEALQQMSGE